MANDKLKIILNFDDTKLSVTIPREDEEYYRLAAKQITSTVNTYSSIFKEQKRKEEILYMSMLDIALRYQKENARNDTAPFNNILDQLISEIEDALKKQ